MIGGTFSDDSTLGPMTSDRGSSRTLLTVVGLIAVLVGLLGIAVTIYLAFHSMAGMPRPRLPLVGSMHTAWGVITNAALAIAGFGIVRSQDWARILIIIYAVAAIAEYCFGFFNLQPGQVASAQGVILAGVPLLIWGWLMYFFTRPATIGRFDPSRTIVSSTEAASTPVPNATAAPTRPWIKKYVITWLGTYICYAFLMVWLGSADNPHKPANMDALQKLVWHGIVNLGPWLIGIGVGLVPAVIALIANWKSPTRLKVFFWTDLIAAWPVALLLLYGSWYANTHAR